MPPATTISPLEAALELERRGGMVPADIRAMLNQARLSGAIPTPGLNTPGITIRGRDQPTPGFNQPTFSLPGGAVSRSFTPTQTPNVLPPIQPNVPRGTIPQTPTTSQTTTPAQTPTPPQNPLLPPGVQSLVSAENARNVDQQVAEVLRDLNRQAKTIGTQASSEKPPGIFGEIVNFIDRAFTGERPASLTPDQTGSLGPAFFKKLSFPEQVEFASKFVELRDKIFTGLPRNQSDEAQRAVALLDDESKGGKPLDPQVKAQLQTTVQENLARAEKEQLSGVAGQLGPIAAGVLNASSAITLGAGPALRNVISPEFRGLETELSVQRPVASAIGKLAGSVPLVIGASGAGAVTLGRLAAGLGAGEVGQLVAAITGRFLAGTLAQAPVAAGEALSQGATLPEAGETALEVVAAIPKLIAKLPAVLRGEEDLTLDDRLNIGFTLLEAVGLPKDIASLRQTARSRLPLKQRQALLLADIITDPQNPNFNNPDLIRAAATDAFANRQTLQAPDETPIRSQINAGEAPNNGINLGPTDQPTPNLDEFGRLARGESIPGLAQGIDPNTGARFQIQTLPDNRVSLRTFDESGAAIENTVFPDIQTAREALGFEPPNATQIDTNLPNKPPRTRNQSGRFIKSPPPGDITNLGQNDLISRTTIDTARRGTTETFDPNDPTATPNSERNSSPSQLEQQTPKSGEDFGTAQTILGDKGKDGVFSADDIAQYVETTEPGGGPLIRDIIGEGPFVVADIPVERIDENSLVGGDINAEKLQNARDFLAAGSPTPPIVAGLVGDRLVVAEGTHRLIAAREIGQTTIPTVVSKAFADSQGFPNTGQRKSLESPVEPTRIQEPTAANIDPETTRTPTETSVGKQPETIPPTEITSNAVLGTLDDTMPTRLLAEQLIERTRTARNIEDIGFSNTPDSVLLRALAMTEPNSREGGLIRAQAKSRGLSESDAGDIQIRVRAAEERLRTLSNESLPDAVSELPDELLKILAFKKKAGPLSRALRAEATKRGLDFQIQEAAKPPSTQTAQDSAGGPLAFPSSPIGAQIRGRVRSIKAGQALASALSPHTIINNLNRALGLSSVGIGGARILKRWAGGFYRVVPESIRLRMADDLDVHIHEIGHHLHKLLLQGGLAERATVLVRGIPTRISRTGLLESQIPSAWHKELDALGRALYGSRQPASGYISEGFAELTRLAFTDQRAAFALAPTAYTDFIRRLQTELPSEYKALVEFRNRYQLYRDQSAATKVMGFIVQNGTPKGPIQRVLLDAYDRLRTAWFDRFQPLVRLKKDLDIGENELPSDLDPEFVTRRALGRVSGDLDLALHSGRVDPKTSRIIPGSKGLIEILRPVVDEIPEFNGYLATVRAIEKRAQGNKGVFQSLTHLELSDAVKEFESIYPHFKQVAADFQVFNEWLIRTYATGHGLITPKQAEAIIAKNLHFVTFKKVKVQDQVATSGKTNTRKGFINISSGIKRFSKFSGEQIEPPLESFVASMESIMRNAQLNRVGQSLVMLFNNDPRLGPNRAGGVEGIGRWLDKIDRPIDAVSLESSFVLKELVQRMKTSGIDIGSLDQDTIISLVNLIDDDDFTMFRPGLRTDKASREFRVLIDGKPQFFQAKDKRLFDMLEGIGDAQTVSLFTRTLVNAFKLGATTLNPEFFAINFLRDGFFAFTTTESNQAPATRINAWLQAFLTGDPGEMFKASGATASTLFSEYADGKTGRVDFAKLFGKRQTIKTRIKQGRYLSAIGEVLRSPVDLVRVLNERAELATRLGEFNANISGIENPLRADIEAAGQAASEITLDFQRGGTASKRINQVVPFFNASFIGLDRLARFIKKNPARAFGKIFAGIIAPSMAIHLLNRDNPAFWDQPQDKRDRSWFVPFWRNGKSFWIVIPKPFGLGAFGVLTERFLARVDGIDPVTGKRGDPGALKGISSPLLESFRPPYTIPVATSTFELISNYSIFFGGPIVRQQEQQGPIGERGAERSSELAYIIGRSLDIEPPKIDYAIRGLFAGVGDSTNKYVVSPLTRVIRTGIFGGEPKPERLSQDPLDPSAWYLVHRILTAEPKSNTETGSRFWNTFDNLENVFKGFTARKSDPSKQTRFFNENEAQIESYRVLLPFKNRVNELFRQLKQQSSVTDTPNISEDERRLNQDKLFQDIQSTMRAGLNQLSETTRTNKP